MWKTYNTRVGQGETMRVFPLSNWTNSISGNTSCAKEIPIVPLYFAAMRPVVKRDGMLIMVDDDRMPIQPEEELPDSCAFRTLGCYPLTGAVESDAVTVPEILREMLTVRTSERQSRLIDTDEVGAMEKKKREGYF